MINITILIIINIINIIIIIIIILLLIIIILAPHVSMSTVLLISQNSQTPHR